MPRHGNILVGEAARAMRRPVHVNRPDPLDTPVSVCNSIFLVSWALGTYHSHGGVVLLDRTLRGNQVDKGLDGFNRLHSLPEGGQLTTALK